MKIISNYVRLSVLGIASIVILAGLVACGGSSGDGQENMSLISQVDLSDSRFTIDDFTAVNLKVSKEFDVTGLEGAVVAYKGIYGPPKQKEVFELRFYPSHNQALDFGVSYAQDVTGEDRVILESDQRWKEGHKLRITCQGQGGHHIGKCISSYPEYLVRGNVVMLCGGRTVENALENCETLMTDVLS